MEKDKPAFKMGELDIITSLISWLQQQISSKQHENSMLGDHQLCHGFRRHIEGQHVPISAVYTEPVMAITN